MRKSFPAEFKGSWALVTGGGSGIGGEFARQLAERGMNLVLVGRDSARLEATSQNIQKEYGVRCLVLSFDLSDSDSPARIRNRLMSERIRIQLLINNAAFGAWGRFEETPLDKYSQMLRLNVEACVRLSYELFEDLKAYPTSAIIHVSSSAAIQPVPYMAVYAATKAFLLSFSQALHAEWERHGIRVQVLVPGPTRTDFGRVAGTPPALERNQVDPGHVVRKALEGLCGGSPVVYAARGVSGQRWFAFLAPPFLLLRWVARMMDPGRHRLRH